MPTELQEPTIYSSLICQSELHLIANGLANRLLCSPAISAAEAVASNKTLDSWKSTVPTYFQNDQAWPSSDYWYLFARSRLWWRFWNLQIILFRPILLRCAIQQLDGKSNHPRNSDEEQCKEICFTAAHLTIESISNYISQTQLTRLAGWYSLYVFDSDTIIINTS